MNTNASPLGALLALVSTAVYSLILYALRDNLSTPIVALLYLVPVLFSSSLWGLGAGVVASVGAFLAFNYLFIPPYYTLSVHQTPDLIALIIFLAVGILSSQLVGRMRAAIARVEAREHQVAQLYRFSAVMVGLRREQDVANHVVRGLAHVLNADVVQGIIKKDPAAVADIFLAPEGRAVPDGPPQATAPLITDRGKLGDIRLWREQEPLTESERRVMQTFAEQGALALERALLEQSEARAGLLEESDRMKSALLSSVSHELRTPLVTIKAAVTSLLSGEVKWDSAARHDLLAALDEETDRLNALVGDLLDMTRIEAGALKLRSQWNVLAEITDAALARLSSRMDGRTVEVEISEDLPMVWVDQTLIQQVFVNLLDNSLKYSPPDKPISVLAMKTKDKKLKVEIANHGPSVAAEDLNTIFERFHRVTDADRVPGTGLGLSICKGIIEAHGEKIHAENRKDGFAFIFTLPILHDGKTATAAMRTRAMSNNPHILVIDDEPQIVRALKTILAEKEYRITTASRGEEGLAMAAAVLPDVVILDIGLPDMSGLDVCSRLREWSSVPIIVLSVLDSEADKVAILDRGADDYLTKPFGIDELLARIKVALRHRTQAQGASTPKITVGDVDIDLAAHIVTRGGEEIRLTATEFSLLAYLAANAGRVLTHRAILEHVWGWAESDNVEYLRVYMMQLRKKLEADPRHPVFLITEAGVGYRFLRDRD